MGYYGSIYRGTNRYLSGAAPGSGMTSGYGVSGGIGAGGTPGGGATFSAGAARYGTTAGASGGDGSLAGAQSAANAANEARYTQGLGILQGAQTTSADFLKQGLSNLAGYGQSAIADVNRQAGELSATNEQDLISRGLGNSTVLGTMRTGVENQRQQGVNRVTESQMTATANMNQAQAQNALAGAAPVAQFIENRTDQAPDLGMYSGLQKQASEAQGELQAGAYAQKPAPATPISQYDQDVAYWNRLRAAGYGDLIDATEGWNGAAAQPDPSGGVYPAGWMSQNGETYGSDEYWDSILGY